MTQVSVADIRRAIESASGCRRPKPERRYHKHDQYLSYGLKAADFRTIMKPFEPRFVELPVRKRLVLAADLLAEHVGELGHVGIYVVAIGVTELEPKHLPRLDRLGDDFRSWSHVDHFCGTVIVPLLRTYRQEVLDFLADWNVSTNRWKRRGSVVTFTGVEGESGQWTDEVLRLCDNLIWDEEDIVRKGVGWALKDNLRSSPRRILPYIKNLRRKGVSSTIILYAIRDLKGVEREKVLAVKKTPKKKK
jgi:3-methyladenine DNA glycosylase AlkD